MINYNCDCFLEFLNESGFSLCFNMYFKIRILNFLVNVIIFVIEWFIVWIYFHTRENYSNYEVIHVQIVPKKYCLGEIDIYALPILFCPSGMLLNITLFF